MSVRSASSQPGVAASQWQARGRPPGDLEADRLPHESIRRLGPQETRRRLVHMLPGLLPLILVAIPHRDPLRPVGVAVLAAIGVGLSVVALMAHPAIGRRREQSLIPAVLGYAGVVVALLVAFPGALELALAVMTILAFGDGMATLVGLTVGRRRLPWNREKTWAGLVAFLCGAVPSAAFIYWIEARPPVGFATALLCAAPAAAAAAIAESVDSRINDNIRVGLVAAVTILATHAMFVGW